MDDELEGIKRRKVEELQRKSQKEVEDKAQLQQQISQLEEIVKQVLTKDALQRYGNLKTAHPEKAVQLLVVIANAIQSQGITRIDDDQLKNVLMMLEKKRNIKIRYK